MLIAGAKDNKKVTKPIFIVGAPRSGTTLLYQILCNHRDLSWECKMGEHVEREKE